MRYYPQGGDMALAYTSSSSVSFYHLTCSITAPYHRCVSKCCSVREQQKLQDEEEKDCIIYIEERIAGKLTHRYSLDGSARHPVLVKITEGKCQTINQPSLFDLPQSTLNFILPSGFPGSVSSDYLNYMTWQFPTNVTAWICSTLVTSSLLKAVGIDAGAGSAAAATAAIKWVSKDGLGAIGRLLIGGRFGTIFDEDPKQWRMYADIIGSAGGMLELATPLVPGYFLLLASLGNLTKALARGLKDPSFRVIQNHFAIADNVGDVSAKEEVWEVAAKIVGLIFGVSLLAADALAASYPLLAISWAVLRITHLWLRYKSLEVLVFPTINYKRASCLLQSYIQGSEVPDCILCNRLEPILLPPQLMFPRVLFGCSLKDIIGPRMLSPELESLLKLYKDETYVLILHPNRLHGFEARILFKDGATSLTMLRSLYQANLLLHRMDAEFYEGNSKLDGKYRLKNSLYEMQLRFTGFLEELERVGWDLEKIVIKVPVQKPVYVFTEDTDL